MTPHPTPEPPQGYELLPETFLREHGAVEGMLKRIEYSTDRWEAWRPGWNLNEHSLKTYTFIAPLGTMARFTPPLQPEKGKGGARGEGPTADKQQEAIELWNRPARTPRP